MARPTVEETTRNALADFWAAVAEQHPEITTGDLTWNADAAFIAAAEAVVTTWIECKEATP